MISKNIVVLSGSPRKNANTDKLVAAFIEGAESASKNVNLFRIADLDIKGCTGCNHCQNTKQGCRLEDDMPQIYDAIRKTDTLVLASPVYFSSVTAQLKAALDRLFALMPEGFQVKRGALLVTCAERAKEEADGSIVVYEHIMLAFKGENAGIIIATGLWEPDDIDGRPELDEARVLGEGI